MRFAKANIRKWYASATPAQRTDGFCWYPMARATAEGIAAEYGISVECAAGVIAALSPRNRWHKNVEYAYALVSAVTSGTALPFCGLTDNRAKAVRIARGESPELVLGGDKVRAFYANIMGDTQAVTVDVWAARACGHKSDAVNRSQYRTASVAYRAVASELGITPRELQSIVWVTIREGL